MSIILMTTLFDKALILQGEIWCWSLLGLRVKSQINSYLNNTHLTDYCYIQYSIFEANFTVNQSDWFTFSILFSNSSFLASVVLWSATF